MSLHPIFDQVQVGYVFSYIRAKTLIYDYEVLTRTSPNEIKEVEFH